MDMDMKRVVICVLLMALVTYIPRVLPLTIFRKQIKSRFIRSFLGYTLYAVLDAMTFPDVFTSACGDGGGADLKLLQKRTGDGGMFGHRGGLSYGNDFIEETDRLEVHTI